MKLQNHVFLIGFMGCGKTTIGKLLADQLKVQFIDTDSLIKERTHLSIPEIFSKWGEGKFRELEEQAIESIVSFPPSVISLGGGAILSKENRSIIFNSGLSIYLKWRRKTLYERLLRCKDRPLLYNVPVNKLLEHIIDMMKKRKKYYECAHIVVTGDNFKTLHSLIEHLKHEISTYNVEVTY